MSGLVKGKEYKVEDSNVEGLGSDEDRALKKKVAQNEPAWKHWEQYLSGAILNSKDSKSVKGKPHHVEIWRIEKFKVKFWPREQHGSFCEGDSYIILHTYKNADDKVCWDVHFWLGKDTTQDEMGTAAYKTVELDTLMDDGPVQHREVQGHESELFNYIFDAVVECGGLRYLPGGVESGFRHVEVEELKTTLSHIKGTRKRVNVTQVSVAIDSLNSGDVFLLEMKHPEKKGWSYVITWTGKSAGQFEKNKARQVAAAVKTERKGKCEVIGVREGDEDDDMKTFYKELGHSGSGSPNIKSADEGGSDEEPPKKQKVLFRLSDASGSLTFTKEAEGMDVSMSKFDTNDVFVLDSGEQVFAWIGRGATKQEKDNGITSAVEYLKKQNRPLHTPVTRVIEGAESAPFKEAMGTQN